MEDENWYTREEASPGEHGHLPSERPIEALREKSFVVVDKPHGPTSNQVSYWVEEELDLDKSGHFGTLDPNATGLLPVGINRGTRINPALADAEKEYVFEASFNEKVNGEKFREALNSFQGVNEQVPPEKSAVKQEERERTVYEAEALEVDGENALARIRCESGFYVRVLVDQLAEKLGVEGEMQELRRTRQGGLTEEDADTLQDIVDAYHFFREGDEEAFRKVLHPVEDAVKHLRKVAVKDSAVHAVANGADLGTAGISRLQGNISQGERVAVMTLKGELIALGAAEKTSQQMFDEEGTAVQVNNVYMDPGLYPKRWKQG